MDKLTYGDITVIGITTSGLVSIQFYDPSQLNGEEYSTIYLTIPQVEIISKLGEILSGKTD